MTATLCSPWEQITEHFDRAEFGCKDGTSYPPGWVGCRLVPLCQLLEELREALGGVPIEIVSGYRTQGYNATLKRASPRSQHLNGKAADIRAMGVTPREIHAEILRLRAEGKLVDLGGLGLYHGFVHVDIRPRIAGRIAQWIDDGAEKVA